MTARADEAAILDIKSTSLYAIRVVLNAADLPAILEALEQRMADAAGFFEDEPVVIDASKMAQPLDWARLADALKAHGLPVIGVMAPGALAESVREAGYALLSLPAAPTRAPAAQPAAAAAIEIAEPAEPAAVETAPEPIAAPAPRASVVIDKPLRSGQRVYARDADLIVLGIVSHGAEVIADGNVHVYGPLRGKAMAGARGDTHARIFTTQFEAELISVAGVYRALTAPLPELQGKPALVRLDGEKLLTEPLPI